MRKNGLRACAFSILIGYAGPAFAESNPWYFTASEIEAAYRYQRNYGQRLQNSLNPHDCYYGKPEFLAQFRGRQFSVSCRFVQHTSRHLKTMLEKGMARYLFPLDAGHAHLLIPLDLWEREYSGLSAEQMLPRLLHEPRLAVLYHSAEHLLISDENQSTTAKLENWKSQRNVLGFYDGREIQILPPHADGSGHERVEGYQTVHTFVFLGHRRGAFFLLASGISHSFDLSLEDDLAAEMPAPQTVLADPRATADRRFGEQR
jgi:hypothetical protein